MSSKPRARDLELPFPGRTAPKFALELRPIWAGYHALNGNGEMTGTHWIEDAGYFCSPICLTNTHSVGIAHHATVKWMIGHYAREFAEDHVWAMPVVAETYDGVLNDINGQHVCEADVLAAIQCATSGAIQEGNVGGGTGMICYEFKGGTGTASRVVEAAEGSYTIGVLVQANHGIRDWLSVLGVPVGSLMREDRLFQTERGSIIVVIGTNAPMLPHQLRRVAKRAAIGIGRNGTPGGNDSGDIFLAFSVANDLTMKEMRGAPQSISFIPDDCFDPFYLATVEAIEEAVINALVAAESITTVKPIGQICRAIDHSALQSLVKLGNPKKLES
jgi:D-aminopeptidase